MDFAVPQLLVIPAFNEEASLLATLESLRPLPPDYEVLIVNDGSTDRTAKLAADWIEATERRAFLVQLSWNCGIGAAVQTGYRFAAARSGYEHVIQFDADGQHAAEDVVRLVQSCRDEGFDLCIGSRFRSPEQGNYRSTWLRRFGSRFIARLIRSLGHVDVTDPTSGLRCAGPRAWRAFAEYYPDDYPEPESLFWAARHRFSVGEISVRMAPRFAGRSSIRPLATVYYMLKVTVAILVDRLRTREVT